MNLSERPLRSSELMSRTDTGLLIVDMQGKLLDLIEHHATLAWNCRRLVDGAKLLGVPLAATEQYPAGLGPTIDVLKSRLPEIPEKTAFSCLGCETMLDAFRAAKVYKLLLAGIETHVCVLQTALDLLAEGFQVYLAVDAVGSRHPLDHDTALHRMESSGAVLTTTETALFEWCADSKAAEFKQISGLVRETGP